MNVTLNRNAYGPDGIFGVMTRDDNGTQIAVTLEHAVPNNDGNMTEFFPEVAAGTYACHLYDSPHFGRKVWMLDGVPGHTFIEIHTGNFNQDSKGCILLGRRVIPDPDEPDQNMITSSKNVFLAFMDLQNSVTEFQITVKDSE